MSCFKELPTTGYHETADEEHLRRYGFIMSFRLSEHAKNVVLCFAAVLAVLVCVMALLSTLGCASMGGPFVGVGG